jgi:hypothetical protein
MKKKSLITAMILMVLISSASYGATPAGPLSVSGNKIVNQSGDPVSFAGMSFFWSNWAGGYYNADCVNWLVQDWQVTIVRAAMGVEADGGYLQEPTREKNKVIALVDAAINAGIYVIIDWHSHEAHNYQSQAISFFQEMATTYGGYDNVIYEIYNEPLDWASWSGQVKPYSEAVIAAIRAIDPDNLIIVGSPHWSQDVHLCAADPITGYSNIAYTVHFYSANHKQWLRDRCTSALNSGIALMATEWGATNESSDPETVTWMNYLASNDISHCNWSVNDKDEPWSCLKPNIGMYTGGWSASDLSNSGTLVRSICLGWEGVPPPPPEGDNLALNQPTICSSTESGSYGPENAVDGSTSTRWSSEYDDPEWIYVDLGEELTITAVRLNWEAAYGSAYQIQVSNNASDWTDVYSTSSGDGGIDDIELGDTSARYVRMYGTGRGTPYGYSLWEFEVYGSAGASVGLYQHCDYGGWSANFGVGTYTTADIEAAGGVNNDVSSLTIPGFTVTVYDEDNFGGSSLVLTENTSCLVAYGFNDIISSMVVEASGGDITPPAAPAGLTATAGDSQVSLDWDDNSEHIAD